MAQTKKKRRRKHAGTQAGTITRRPAATKKPETKAERRAASQQRRLERLDRAPTLKGAVSRAAIAAGIFAIVVVLAFQQPLAQGILLALLMFVLYVPIGYYTDLFIYRYRQRKKRRESEAGST